MIFEIDWTPCPCRCIGGKALADGRDMTARLTSLATPGRKHYACISSVALSAITPMPINKDPVLAARGLVEGRLISYRASIGERGPSKDTCEALRHANFQSEQPSCNSSSAETVMSTDDGVFGHEKSPSHGASKGRVTEGFNGHCMQRPFEISILFSFLRYLHACGPTQNHLASATDIEDRL
jgi:hypothetical protein